MEKLNKVLSFYGSVRQIVANIKHIAKKRNQKESPWQITKENKQPQNL